MSRFSDTLMEYFQYPVNRGSMKNPTVVGRGSLDGYPPFVTLNLLIEGEHVARATFEAEGCGVTIACGSMLTELITGSSLAECAQITAHELSLALEGVPSGKEYCVEVAVSALRDALKNCG